MSLDVKKLFLNLEELFLIPEMSVEEAEGQSVTNVKWTNGFFFNISILHPHQHHQPNLENELNWIKNILKHIFEWLVENCPTGFDQIKRIFIS